MGKVKESKEALIIAPQQTEALNPSQLLSQAIDKGLGIEQLEKLMTLQDHWERRQAEKAFNFAMNEFQANKPDLIKTNSVEFNGKHQFNFIPLAKIQKLIDPVLSKCGLSYSWKQGEEEIEIDNKKVTRFKITCIVKHIDGHSAETHLSALSDMSGSKNAIQGIGSTVSYLKRYTLSNALGLSADEDTDGEGTELTKDEIHELELIKIVEMYADKVDKLPKAEKERLDIIIKTKETASYRKVIARLRSL